MKILHFFKTLCLWSSSVVCVSFKIVCFKVQQNRWWSQYHTRTGYCCQDQATLPEVACKVVCMMMMMSYIYIYSFETVDWSRMRLWSTHWKKKRKNLQTETTLTRVTMCRLSCSHVKCKLSVTVGKIFREKDIKIIDFCCPALNFNSLKKTSVHFAV